MQVVLSQKVGLNAVNDESLDPPLVDQPGIADIFPSLAVVVAGIVEEAGGLGRAADHSRPALSAVEEPTEQVVAVDRPRMGHLRASFSQQSLHLLKHLVANNRRVIVLNADDLFGVLGPWPSLAFVLPVPNQCSRIRFILEHIVNIVLVPQLAFIGPQPIPVQRLDDFLGTHPISAHLKYLLDNRSEDLVRFKASFLIIPVHEFLGLVSDRNNSAIVISSSGILFHAPKSVLGQVDRIELINDLDHALQELACGALIHLLVDGNHGDAIFPQQ